MRICALCLASIDPLSVVLYCGGCNRRVYCSQECQRIDWEPTPIADKVTTIAGQGHMKWCGIATGEEGIDWRVEFVNDTKGFGIIALRNFRSGERIMVDGLQRSTMHPAFQTLAPMDGTLREKFDLNAVGCSEGLGSAVAPRLSRANHSCFNNAGRCHEEFTDTIVMYAQRDILAGEEICINYVPWNNAMFEDAKCSNQSRRNQLKHFWSIVCPNDCFCRRSDIELAVDECIVLNAILVVMLDNDQAMSSIRSVRVKFMETITKLMELMKTIHSSPASRVDCYKLLFEVAILKQEDLQLGLDTLDELIGMHMIFQHPQNPVVLQLQEWKRNPQSRTDYFGE
ncbi:UNVERIFIED_CONTAM: hypothetical protein HDU68_006037 [Siphonaria sp. JEL0065]|nr:hypothetical protein HDU68_006037 [Siphonaria sp. JEL0065]